MKDIDIDVAQLHTDALFFYLKETPTDITTELLTPFLKNSDKFRKIYFLALLGQLGTNIPKVALLLGV